MEVTDAHDILSSCNDQNFLKGKKYSFGDHGIEKQSHPMVTDPSCDPLSCSPPYPWVTSGDQTAASQKGPQRCQPHTEGVKMYRSSLARAAGDEAPALIVATTHCTADTMNILWKHNGKGSI